MAPPCCLFQNIVMDIKLKAQENIDFFLKKKSLSNYLLSVSGMK
jgi:hypothetical protein